MTWLYMKTKLKFYEIFLFINVYTILLSRMIEEVLKLHNIKAYVMVFTLKLVLQSYVLLNTFSHVHQHTTGKICIKTARYVHSEEKVKFMRINIFLKFNQSFFLITPLKSAKLC